MGRPKWSNKSVVEDCLRISTQWLSQNGYFEGFKVGRIQWNNCFGEITTSIGIRVDIYPEDIRGGYARLIYSRTHGVSGQRREIDYSIKIIRTKCQFGGFRYWFVCPLSKNGQGCNRKIGKLYLPPRADYFGCRHCYDLTYQSCQENHKFDGLYKEIAGRVAGATPSMVKKILYDSIKS